MTATVDPADAVLKVQVSVVEACVSVAYLMVVPKKTFPNSRELSVAAPVGSGSDAAEIATVPEMLTVPSTVMEPPLSLIG